MLMVAEKNLTAHAMAPLVEEAPAPEYTGFPLWHALLTEPNREERAAEWLRRVDVHVYLPQFSKVVARRGHLSTRRLYAVVAGMLFAPQEVLAISRRDDVFAYAHVRGFLRTAQGFPALLRKNDIEEIRRIEALLNLPPPKKEAVRFRKGDHVRFSNDVLAAMWGTGIVVELASASRIGIEVEGLFGRATKVYAPQSEIEAM